MRRNAFVHHVAVLLIGLGGLGCAVGQAMADDVDAQIEALRATLAKYQDYQVAVRDLYLSTVLDSEYIRMAELKGMPARRVLLRHALPNALVPTLNITALNLGYLIGGVVIVERVFSFPGFGTLLIDSVQVLDIPVIEATVLLAAAVYIAANLVADVGAILLNPRLRTG